MAPDLDTVIARRAAVAKELEALDRMRGEIEAEEQELLVAERVLKRLSGGADEADEPFRDEAAEASSGAA